MTSITTTSQNHPIMRAPLAQFTTRTLNDILDDDHTLAVIRFGYPEQIDHIIDPRIIRIPLPLLANSKAIEYLSVNGAVEYSHEGHTSVSQGGGWMYVAVEIEEAEFNHDIEAAAAYAYQTLCTFLKKQSMHTHVQRIWNYLDRITEGTGDAERYRRFCVGRNRGINNFFGHQYPAATCIGYPKPTGKLSLYCLASTHPGMRIENPRQVNAWQYPRQYGKVSPDFARAMRLPANDALSISGTAAITGHESRHNDDLYAQLDEIRRNIHALLSTANMPLGLDSRAPLKVYVKHPADADKVRAYMHKHLPQTPHILLHGDICRRELLVEIEGWRYGD